VIEVNGCMCGCGGPRFGVASLPTREVRLRWLEDYQRDLEQRMAAVAEEIKDLKDGTQHAS
jgi:hypothetical protein